MQDFPSNIFVHKQQTIHLGIYMHLTVASCVHVRLAVIDARDGLETGYGTGQYWAGGCGVEVLRAVGSR